MSATLKIRKGMVNIQGRNRPCIQVQAAIPQRMQALLLEHFSNENLFKRSSYANGFPAGAPIPSPSIAPHLLTMLKNDACPEITVKSILAGQTHQGQSIWEMMAFEYIAKRAFDGLVDLMACAGELQTETLYAPGSVDLAVFVADAADLAVDAVSKPSPVRAVAA